MAGDPGLPLDTAGAAVGLAAGTALLLAPLRQGLRHFGVTDRPNARSSHTRPTPRGAGLLLMPLFAAMWSGGNLWRTGDPGLAWLGLPALVLTAVSFIDDLRGLPALLRLIAQALAVAIGLSALGDGLVFQGLVPFWLDRALAGLAWLWFVNLFNFMDGIDGLAGTETLVIAGGLILLSLAVPLIAGGLLLPALWLLAVTLGFLVWNWPPAKIFLGDSGAVPLGFVLGGLLLTLAAAGYWAAALLLPAYHGADATRTLLRRLFRGAKIWHPHREHAYQRAVHHAGWSPARVCRDVAALGLGLVGCALWSVIGPVWPGLLLGAGLVAAVLARFESGAHPNGER